MEFGFTTAAYVVSAVLFILSLGGLSGQESAKRAVWYGIAGMALAVVATLIGPGSGYWLLSLILIAAGGAIGYQLATKVQMTQMPELVADEPGHDKAGHHGHQVGAPGKCHVSRKAIATARVAGSINFRWCLGCGHCNCGIKRVTKELVRTDNFVGGGARGRFDHV